MTPVEMAFVALFVAAFVIFMVTLFAVTWYVEGGASSKAGQPARAAQRQSHGSLARHA
jgi:hypothetical protein